MANTYVLIESVIVGSGGSASITFSSIPQTYTDLKLVCSARVNITGDIDSVMVRPNGSSASLTNKWIQGDITSSGSISSETYSFILVRANGNGSTANTFSNGDVYFPNYTNSNYKSTSNDSVTEGNGTRVLLNLVAGLRSDTAAITSLLLVPETSAKVFMEHSSFYLYGIKNS